MSGGLIWTAPQAPRFHNYRAAIDEGTLFLDHPDRKDRIGLRYQPEWRGDVDLSTCLRLATGLVARPAEHAHAKALLGIQGRQGWFRDITLAKIALDAAIAGSRLPGEAWLTALGFRPWPRPGRSGAVQGYRWKGPRGARLLVLAGPDLVVLRQRRKTEARPRTLMRITWRTCSPDRPLRVAVWPEAIQNPTSGLAMAAAIAHHLLQKDLS